MGESFNSSKDPMIEMFVFETNQLLERLEEVLLESEENQRMSGENINEIFRVMHTIKGSAAMMMFDNISAVAHTVEDLFDYLRENSGLPVDHSDLCDIVLSSADFIKGEIARIMEGIPADGDEEALLQAIRGFLQKLKTEGTSPGIRENGDSVGGRQGRQDQAGEGVPGGEGPGDRYIARVHFEEGCRMENMRAFAIIHSLEDLCSEIYYRPANILEDNASADEIARNGFDIYFTTSAELTRVEPLIREAAFVDSCVLQRVETYADKIKDLVEPEPASALSRNDSGSPVSGSDAPVKTIKQNLVSVDLSKVDKLMDLVGEIVITESMVVNNPDLEGLPLDNFKKATTQLRKLTDELRDIVMNIRMVPVAATFRKMHRIVRDMGRKLDKDVDLVIIGEETEVDKSIIDALSDPLMHIVRNAMDHGIEDVQERLSLGKAPRGRITLEARNSGGDVIILVSDDGRGLDREGILAKAREKGLINRPESELTDREVFSFVFLPGFSTNSEVTEFSGRGVGLDVVVESMEKIGGSVSVDSIPGKGTTVSLRIPLTLAIVDGMLVSVGNSTYTIPIVSIRETFKARKEDLIVSPDGHEMIMIRGHCHPILRLHEKHRVATAVTDLTEGIMTVIEWDGRALCLFADALVGVQQVVIKPIPPYLARHKVKNCGIGGCTILGDGSISLILDVASLIGSVLA